MNRLLELLKEGDIIGRSNNGYWEFRVRENALSDLEKQAFYETPEPFEIGNTLNNREKVAQNIEKLRQQGKLK
ncbi:MAG: hypothetical protein IKU77_06190 [Alistipes sp.]|nr:hypothetical protein [Alistipes sp.]